MSETPLEPASATPPVGLRSAISPSRAADFMQCPLLYRFRVVDRLPEPRSAAAARGTLVHTALERLFDVERGRRTPEHAKSLLAGEWDRMVQQDPELAELAGADASNWFGPAEALVDRWFTLENPDRLEPEARELYVEAQIDGLTFRGYIDRLDVAPTGEIRVVDYKTGRSPSALFEAKALFQMKFYALVLWRTRGVVPAMLQLVYLGNGEIVRYQPTEHELRSTERKVKALWDAIRRAAQTGDWRPSPSRLCNWCDHRALCPAFGGTPPPLPDHAAELAVDPETAGAAGYADD